MWVFSGKVQLILYILKRNIIMCNNDDRFVKNLLVVKCLIWAY